MYKKLDEITKLDGRYEEFIDRSYFYGSKGNDEFMLQNPTSLPRFGNLARKALSHYLGEKYDLQTSSLMLECGVREHIDFLVQFKFLNRLKEYDWDYIDNVLKKLIGYLYQLDIPYDQARIDKGFAPLNKSYLEDFNGYNG